MKEVRNKAHSNHSPVTSLGVPAHGRHLKSGSQMHPFVLLLLVVRTAEESGNRAGLPGLLVAVHETHSLPVEVVLALHREQGMDPPRSLLTRFHPPTTIHAQTHQAHRHQNQESSHCSSIGAQISDGYWVRDLNFMALTDTLKSQNRSFGVVYVLAGNT